MIEYTIKEILPKARQMNQQHHFFKIFPEETSFKMPLNLQPKCTRPTDKQESHYMTVAIPARACLMWPKSPAQIIY